MKNVTRVHLDNRYAVGNTTRIARTPLDECFVFKTTPLYQYDYGQILKFDGVTLPEVYEVHFSNSAQRGTAKSVIGDVDGVLIPDEYLLTGESVYVWVFLHEGENDGATEYMAMIPVNRRPQPVYGRPTPVQQDAITEAIAYIAGARSQWENMKAEAVGLAPDEEPTASYEEGVLTLGIPTPDTLWLKVQDGLLCAVYEEEEEVEA